jgi:hypothetical protein
MPVQVEILWVILEANSVSKKNESRLRRDFGSGT